jgi:hypothetical protein
MSQQFALLVHVIPFATHVADGAPHVPELHELLQHSLFFVQVAPSLEQLEVWHVPETQSLLQHPALLVQVAPRLAQVGCAHLPPVQVPLQHGALELQDLPEAMHAGALHMPPVHDSVQQSLGREHPCPVVRHTSWLQVPATHDSLQQSLYELHSAPPSRHLPAGTGTLPPSPPELPRPSTVGPSVATIESPASPPPSDANPAPVEPPDEQPCPATTTGGTARSSAARVHERSLPSEYAIEPLIFRSQFPLIADSATHASLAWKRLRSVTGRDCTFLARIARARLAFRLMTVDIRVPAACAEFPNDNPLLHGGAIWACETVIGAVSPTPRVQDREERVEFPADASTDAIPPALAADGIPDDIEIVDEIVIEDVVEEVAHDPCESVPPAGPDDAFATLARLAEDVARAAGATEQAIAVLQILLGQERLGSEAPPEHAVLRSQAAAWAAILHSESGDFEACGPAPLDEWSARVVGVALGEPGRVDALRRELRRRGVAAFGLVADAA